MVENSETKPLIVRTLPGFHAVEDATWLGSTDQVIEEAERFTETHFGVRSEELDFARPDDDTEIELDDLPAEMAKHPNRLLVDYMYDETIVPYLLELGVDLRTEHGPPLRSTYALAPAIEAAVRGIAGRMPEADVTTIAGFESWIAKEAKAFRNSKPRRSRE